MARILKACDQYPRKNSLGLDNRARIKAFVLLLRYSGLRLQDATTLEKVRLQEGVLFLYTQKTGTPVYLPLPPHVVESITTIRPASDERFFWSTSQRALRSVTIRPGFGLARMPWSPRVRPGSRAIGRRQSERPSLGSETAGLFTPESHPRRALLSPRGGAKTSTRCRKRPGRSGGTGRDRRRPRRGGRWK